MNARSMSVTTPLVTLGALTLLSATLALCPACRPGGETVRIGGTIERAPPPEGTAVVFGTVHDLRTGAPAEGVEIIAPDGGSARTDEQGRFEIGGLPVGTSGEVRARARDGREAVNRLLPLARERREIVLYLEAR